jgi:hypothetical protein
MSRAINQMQMQPILPLRDQDAFVGQRDARIGRIRDVGEKYALPNGSALRACTSCT